MKQANLVKQMSVKELHMSLYLSQLIFFCLGLLLSVVLFDHLTMWLDLLTFNLKQIFIFGVLLAIIVVIAEIVLINLLPKKSFDDGGINEKIFKDQSIGTIFLIALSVAIAEEILFRGLIQTVFGIWIASSIFALVHVRYLAKPVLFIIVILISFLIGYIFELTGNLVVVITFHFVVDFLLGMYIKITTSEKAVTT